MACELALETAAFTNPYTTAQLRTGRGELLPLRDDRSCTAAGRQVPADGMVLGVTGVWTGVRVAVAVPDASR